MSLRVGLFPRCVPAVVRGDCVFGFPVFFAFPLNAGVWRLSAMALGRMRGYVTLKKKKKKNSPLQGELVPSLTDDLAYLALVIHDPFDPISFFFFKSYNAGAGQRPALFGHNPMAGYHSVL